eukprot:TRINITY_DN105_c0_g1_i7.p1 TRINITY_DN105_c0_g1~~TRINITY_DN105_c0_g1_i7.p1  ORF type:complete len:174 (+),score=44.19 TRINITY_DN105_c0_g1_i7:68-589(+)
MCIRDSYNIAWWFLYRRYLALYKEKMVELNEPFVPIIAAKENDKGFLFLPTPENIKHYKFSTFSEPHLNFTGESHKKLLTSKKPAAVKAPISKPVKQEKAPEPVKAPESSPAKPTEEIKKPIVETQAKPVIAPTPNKPATAPINSEAKTQVPTQNQKKQNFIAFTLHLSLIHI